VATGPLFSHIGKAIHPSSVEGQIQGGSAQGIGWTLHEEYLRPLEQKAAHWREGVDPSSERLVGDKRG